MGKLMLPIPPSVNNYLEHYCTRSTPTDVHPIGVRLSERAKQFKYDTGWEAKAVGMRVGDGEMRVDVTMYMGRRHIDLDNILKMLLDALTNIAWNDDDQVAEMHLYRRKCGKGDHPHIEVEVSPVAITKEEAKGVN